MWSLTWLKSLCRASVRVGRLGLLIPRVGAFLCRWVGLSLCTNVWGLVSRLRFAPGKHVSKSGLGCSMSFSLILKYQTGNQVIVVSEGEYFVQKHCRLSTMGAGMPFGLLYRNPIYTTWWR